MPTHRPRLRTPLGQAPNIIIKNGHQINLQPKLGKRLHPLLAASAQEVCGSPDRDFRSEKQKERMFKNKYFFSKMGVGLGIRYLLPLPWQFPPEKRNAFNSSVLVMFLIIYILIFSSEIMASEMVLRPNKHMSREFFSKLIKTQARQWDMLEITNHLIT